MGGNVVDLVERRHTESPDFELEAWITGVKCPNGMTHWKVMVTGEDDPLTAAGILERAVEILRDEQ